MDVVSEPVVEVTKLKKVVVSEPVVEVKVKKLKQEPSDVVAFTPKSNRKKTYKSNDTNNVVSI